MLLRKKVVTTITATSLAILALAGGAGITSILSINDLKDKIREQQRSIDDRIAMHRYIRQEATKINDTRERLNNLADASLVEGQELELITALETTAIETGVAQEISLETANQAEISSWETLVPIRLQVTGTFTQFQNYLRSLDRLSYMISVKSINVNQLNSNRFDADSIGQVRVSIFAMVYRTSKDRPEFLSTLSLDETAAESQAENN